VPKNGGTGWKPPERLRAVEVIGEAGHGVGQFTRPTGLSVDRYGALYVTDLRNHRIQRIAANGKVSVYGRPGSVFGQLWGPHSAALDPRGQMLYVADQGNNRITCYKFATGEPFGGITYLKAPSGVAFDPEGMLWIADTGNGRLLRVDVASGRPSAYRERPEGVVQPIFVVCDAGGGVFVTDYERNDVTRYTLEGVPTLSLTDSRTLEAPRQVAVDKQGRIYVAESGANRLHVFDHEGSSLCFFDGATERRGGLWEPSGVAVGPSGEVYVADTMNHRVLRLAWE
jgi:DNA-binding beta-propeller fold protein YncE